MRTLATLLVIFIVHSVAKPKITPLPEGLLQRSIEVRMAVNIWKVIVTIEDDSYNWNETLHNFYHTNKPFVSGRATWPSVMLQNLMNRVRALSTRHNRRTKRGLINFIGQLSNSLFGTATESEITEIREKIEENRQLNQDISTWQKQYIAVVNRTKNEVIENRKLLNNITSNMYQVTDAIKYIIYVQDIVHRLEVIQARQQVIIHDLEQGRLTENILPLSDLMKIVDGSLPYHWYYRYCTVNPLWDEGLVFEVRLPTVSNHPTLGFHLQAFPIWGPSGHPVTLQVAPYAALDIQSGLVSEPKGCTGKNPAVCVSGLITTDGCASSVITEKDITRVCKVAQAEIPNEIWYALQEGKVVIVLSQPTEITEECSAEGHQSSIKSVTLQKGTYHISWAPGCRLFSKEYAITRAKVSSKQVVVDSWIVPQGAINLMEFFANKTYPSMLPPIVPLSMDPIDAPDKIVWKQGPWSVQRIIMWIILTALCVLGTFITCIILKRKINVPRLGHLLKKKAPKMTPTIEEKDEPTEEPPAKPARAPDTPGNDAEWNPERTLPLPRGASHHAALPTDAHLHDRMEMQPLYPRFSVKDNSVTFERP